MANTDDKAIQRISQGERYLRVNQTGISLCGNWLQEAGFIHGMPLKIRVMPDCLVITAQNTRELWGCLEGLSLAPFNAAAALEWLAAYPDGLNLTP